MDRERSVWRIARGTEDYTLLRRGDLRAGEVPIAWSDEGATAAVRAWWFDGASRMQLTLLLLSLGAFDFGDEDAALRRLARLLASGVIAALRRPYEPLPQTQTDPNDGPGPAPRPRPEEEKTWIEVQLLTPEGQPVSNRRVKIELPDGSAIERTTDREGLCRADGIDPGTCRVTLLDVDRAAWRPQ